MNGLERLLRPRHIAVIGGGTWCASVIRQCRMIGFDGPLWPVHPTRPEIGGEAAFATVRDLPQAPDATFIGVNRAATVDVVRDLAALGAGGAVCFASGFSEAGAELADGADLQADLVAAARDMCLLGPNCYGFINALDGAALWPDHHGAVRVERGVALITQSSNIAINLTMQQRGLPIAYVVTAGNQAQTDLSQIGAALLADPRVTALGLHIEGIPDLRGFEALAQTARALGKPIVALKIGASDQARAATVSHTASLAGSDAGARALLARLGIGQVSSLAALLETLKLLHVHGALASSRIASLSCSGGEASLMADSGQALGVGFPALSADQKADLRAALGPKVALANPLDYHTYIWGDLAAMTASFSAMMAPGLALGCVVLDFPRPDRFNAPEWGLVVDAVQATQAARGVPMAVLASLPDCMPEAMAQDIMARGIAPLSGVSEALEAIAVAAQLGKAGDFDPVLLPGPEYATEVLSEAASKATLAAHGLRVPRAGRAKDAQQAGRVATDIGFPVVLKGEGIAHKTEAGAVVLGLTSARAVEEAARAMAADSFLIEEMIAGGVAELLVGVTRDPAHGFVLTLGAGGTLTEILQDSASLLVPASLVDISQALDGLRIAPLLRGYRGAAGADRAAILRAVAAVQDYVLAHCAGLAEVEVNPLICTPDDAIAADALIRRGEPT
ncbi:acetate--CoA ligase family protein [Tropicibacter oceani]|uniref:Acetate--CoA ligase family protein n=1 Tax=Tropicibacter oceani TaxID=3058420 RepID=A0ABY8QCL4_9RHOB|nr:acetate--CoA ligase family protein [Tropicibacter oceani]WGW02359.1 acetate--CoA ligase family protein [Tropicibacter oceani]